MLLSILFWSPPDQWQETHPLRPADRPPVTWTYPEVEVTNQWQDTHPYRHSYLKIEVPEKTEWVPAPVAPVVERTPAYTGPPAPPGTNWNVEMWRPTVALYWPAELVNWALAIMGCESGGDPNANNPTSSAAGLFQFLRSTWDQGPAPALGLGSYDSGAVYDAHTNIRAAAWLYANWGGKSQWSCKA